MGALAVLACALAPASAQAFPGDLSGLDDGTGPPPLAATSLTTSASADVAVGGRIHDTATLADGVAPTGEIRFALYGPDDPGCAGAPVATSTVPVDGARSYDSDEVTATAPGTYRWVASYGGDAANASSAGACGDAGESVTVSKAATAIATDVSAGTAAGGTIYARATISGGAEPTGTVAFLLYGPGDPTCARPPVAASAHTVDAARTYESDRFTPTRAGAYRWVAAYGGDARNAASGGCADSGATVTVTKAPPTLTTAVSSAAATVGGKLSVRATLAGGAGPTGALTFRLHGPDDPACTRPPVATSTVAVGANGGYDAPAVTVTKPGTYRWSAAYGGDANNLAAGVGCGAAVTVKDVDHTVTAIDAPRAGEAVLALTAEAPGTDWGATGRESAVATVTVDGRYSQDVVLFGGAQPFTYRLALGRLDAGRHDVRVRFDAAKSPAGARGVVVRDMRARMAGGDAARYAPLLYGRDEPRAGGRYENNHTDVPLLAYHTVLPEAGGGRTIVYTVIWSNEDGGTPVDAMMPRWGRTTDIEWVYRVRLDRNGRKVGAEYQDPRHKVHRFDGRRENDHPLLQTAAANNGVTPVRDRSRASRYRFFMDPSDELAVDRAREAEMDAHPWTYELSAAEAAREHKFEPQPSPMTATVSDPRNYLFVRLGKTTTPTSRGWIGTAVDVRLRGSQRWYHSDHNVSDWSVEPDGQVTTSVELPPGTTSDDIRAIRAVAHPVGKVRGGWRVRVDDIAGAFFLDRDYRPVGTSVRRRVGATLSPGHRSRWIWERASG